MEKAKKYTLATIAATATIGTYLFTQVFLNNYRNLGTGNFPVQSISREANPVREEYTQQPQEVQKTQNTQTNNFHASKSLEEIVKEGGLDIENHLYRALINEFPKDYFDGLGFHGSEEFFKEDFILGMKDRKAEDIISLYQKKLESLSDEEKNNFMIKYGEAINLLSQNRGSSIESLSQRVGYASPKETADSLWKSVESSWQKSRLGETFADVINNDILSQDKLDLFLKTTELYCNAKGEGNKSTELISNIKKYQQLMPECNSLYKKADSGKELDETEQKKLEEWVSILSRIEEGFNSITLTERSKAETERMIIERLSRINPLYALAREFPQ